MQNLLFADILIIADDPEENRNLRRVLQASGYTVRRLTSADDVVDTVRRHPPDLLVAGKLAQGDSYALVRRLKREHDLPFFPLLMLLPEDKHELKAAAMNAGADEFITHPVDNAELLIRVRALLRLKQTHEALAEMNATLETKVKERTAELEQAHAKLRHSEKLSALGRFAASVAHDINNPLAGILTYIYLMKKKPPPADKLREDLEIIEEQVQVIAELVKNLQNFARPPKTEREPVQIQEVVESVLALVNKELAQHDIKVKCECALDLPPIEASRGQMQEVLMNLILNARDAMPVGGTLDICAHPDNGHVHLRVRDTGIGIDPEIRPQIFEPFFTTKGEEGTGLGLSICYSIVKEHGGEITVDSVPGEGTEFEIRLPALRQAATT
ncbi:MAG: hybrid sensor histidine kinase/response regulator [Anaerolineae bacterium]